MKLFHCSDPWCRTCVELVADAGLLKPRDDDAAMGVALDRAAEGLAILAEADEEIARAQAAGTDRYVNDPTSGWGQ